MKALLSSFQSAGGMAGGSSSMSGSSPGVGTGGKAGAGPSASSLSTARKGTSVISALSAYAQARSEATAMREQAFGEQLAERDEYIRAQQIAAEIQRNFNSTVEDQLAVASGSGIDVGSGSVVAAREGARAEADRQGAVIQNSAIVNMHLRHARAAALRRAASNRIIGGVLDGFGQLASGFTQAAGAGA